MYTYLLPWPYVSTNSLYEGMGRHRHLAPKAQQWKEEVITLVRQRHIHARVPLRLPCDRISFELRFWPPRDGRKHDADNLVKLAQDSVCAAFLVDDECIWSSCARRQDRSDKPRIVVTISAFEEVS